MLTPEEGVHRGRLRNGPTTLSYYIIITIFQE